MATTAADRCSCRNMKSSTLPVTMVAPSLLAFAMIKPIGVGGSLDRVQITYVGGTK